MFTRLLAALALTLLPTAALADDTQAADSGAPQSSATYMLGPSAIGGATSGSSGGSTGDSTSLQPAGQSPLQSTTSDATGLTAPNSTALQAPASSDQSLRVLSGEADGSPVQVAGSGGLSIWEWVLFSVLFGAIVAAASYILRRNPRLFASAGRVSLPALEATPKFRSKTRKKRRRK